MKRENKKGQVWVETVLYTLIGIAVIGLVLAVAKPKIDAKKDEIYIEQAIESLGNIDDKIYEVQKAVGNKRSMDLKIGEGRVIINMDENTISWIMDSSLEYSEAGIDVPLGRIIVRTEKAAPYQVTVKVNYGVKLGFSDQLTGTKELNAAPTPYHLTIENAGILAGTTSDAGKLKIILREV